LKNPASGFHRASPKITATSVARNANNAAGVVTTGCSNGSVNASKIPSAVT
jgi:hypothetical protein